MRKAVIGQLRGWDSFTVCVYRPIKNQLMRSNTFMEHQDTPFPNLQPIALVVIELEDGIGRSTDLMEIDATTSTTMDQRHESQSMVGHRYIPAPSTDAFIPSDYVWPHLV
jgi:hypothetical protein